ncbi:glycosyltransferase family 2 protein [Bacillus pseudomycoides]|uniref:Glycosyl transferase n=1 Tax=Bacillus pseudomycoides TaxID=64104 RepID=A0ABD6SYF3_9BACI|nr:glycosyltransferase [Bacillus pseudomycoides]PEP78847.1 glycosyl transferase [Bacillus pseudomycoides]PGF06279.1 glycosyl transferase [Bacillus pseudomycoides]PHE86673.1 glycosyl transferase [Bacillus pseudomycoides]
MNKKTVSIIIPVYNEEKTLSSVLESCQQLNPMEIIAVANGCTDRSIEIAKNHNCKVLIYKERLGHNVGRAIGAKEAKGDILLFIDADFTISSSTLNQFLEPLVEGTADVVLNNLDYIFKKVYPPHSITIWKQVMNHFLHCPNLNSDSLVAVPHAMTKEVIKKIHSDSLKNPIYAQLKIIQHQFRISRHMSIDVVTINRVHPKQHKNTPTTLSISEKRIIGNHIETIADWIHETNDSRLNYSDENRRRDIIENLKSNKLEPMPKIITGWGKHSNIYAGKQLSVIIPAYNEDRTIEAVIHEVRKLEPLEIIVVVNGTTDHTEEIVKKSGATVIVYDEKLGNDTGRAIGAYFAKGDILLFIDGDIIIPSQDLLPFVHAIQNGTDLALNNLEYLMKRAPVYIVTACKYAVNLAFDRKDLGVGSPVAIPHAFSRKCIDEIGFDVLVSPVIAQAKTILSGLTIQNVHSVEVDKMNRIRPEKHFAKKGELSSATKQIIGDHIEGISYLIKQKGKRGLF